MKAPSSLEQLPGLLARRPVLLLAAVVLLVLLVVLLNLPGKPPAPTAYFEVRRADLPVSVVEGGTLAAVDEVSIRNEVEGTARIIYIVKEGSYVKKGDLLVELDSSQAEDQVNQQQINLEKAQFALIQAEAQLKIQESATNSDIRAADLKVKFAELDLDKFLRGQSFVDLAEASNNVVKSDASLAVARTTYDYSTKLAERGYETKRTVDSDRLTVMNNEFQLLIASNKVWLLQQFDQPKQQEQLESNVREAKLELDRVVAQSERKIAQYTADLLTQSNTLALNQKKLERDRKNLAATKIKAPQDGLVVYSVAEGRFFSSESLVEEGAVVRNRQELIKLPDISRLKVNIKVHESQVNLVRPGLPALVVLDSMPDTPFRGVVQKVAPLPDSQMRFGNPNLKVYNTEVHITDRLPGVKPGVSARAEIIVTNVANALPVPIHAVTTLKGRPVVYLVSGPKPKAQPVEVGMFNTKFIEITSGVNEGDRLLLSPPFDTQEKDLGGSLASDEKAKSLLTNAPAAPRAATRQAAGLFEPGAGAPPGQAGLTNLLADAGERGGPPDGPGGPRRREGFNPEEMLKQFDKNGDGQLDETEREAMQTAMRERFGGRGGGGPRLSQEEMLKQFDKNGDGQLDETEREAMQTAMRERFGGRGGGRPRLSQEEMLKQFDKDGDGQLDETEREAMQTAMRERFGGRGGGQPRLSQEEMLKQFDKNGDGQLDETEREAMQTAMREQSGGRGGGRSRTNAPPARE